MPQKVNYPISINDWQEPYKTSFITVIDLINLWVDQIDDINKLIGEFTQKTFDTEASIAELRGVLPGGDRDPAPILRLLGAEIRSVQAEIDACRRRCDPDPTPDIIWRVEVTPTGDDPVSYYVTGPTEADAADAALAVAGLTTDDAEAVVVAGHIGVGTAGRSLMIPFPVAGDLA